MVNGSAAHPHLLAGSEALKLEDDNLARLIGHQRVLGHVRVGVGRSVSGCDRRRSLRAVRGRVAAWGHGPQT